MILNNFQSVWSSRFGLQWNPFLHFISYLLSGKLSASCFKNRSLVFFSIPSEFVSHRFYILEIKIFLMPDKSLFYDSLQSDSSSRRTLLMYRLVMGRVPLTFTRQSINRLTAVNYTKPRFWSGFYMFFEWFTTQILTNVTNCRRTGESAGNHAQIFTELFESK